MIRTALLVTAAAFSVHVVDASAQTATQTTARVVITNNMKSSSLTIESSTCGSTASCTINQNSAVAGGAATESVSTTGTSSASWFQDWGAYVGTTHYACHFNISIDSQFTVGACHHISATPSQKAGPGGTSHPSCQATVSDPSLADYSNGLVQFSITQ